MIEAIKELSDKVEKYEKKENEKDKFLKYFNKGI
jgi:hypothetical protein